jgi:type II secretory pathway predicted ATPase ExeA
MLDKIQSFYGFSKMPFGRDIAPGQLHRHHGHAEAVARLTWAITSRSVAVLTGEVGAGKTVAVRAALAGTDPVRYRPIYLPNPAGIGIRGICQQVVIACGQAPRFHTGSLLPQAADALATEAEERGRTPILILDEAHQLDAQQLETIRMLTSYDLDSVTCFAALLVGQPTLRTRLRLGVLAALDQRIGLRAQIDGMTRDETASYIRHHLALAGRGSDTLISDDAITLIHDTSRGLPRTVNNLCVASLIAACAAGHAIADQSAARAAITEVTATS